MELLSFLGTGKYTETSYNWQGQHYKTPYVAEAINHFFKPTVVKVFTTIEAKVAHGDTLQQRLREVIQLIDIPSGKSEPEIWDIFEIVVQSVQPNSQIIFDITHAFRSLPILVLLASAFLQKAKGVKIVGVYYGAFEVNRENPPIFDLTSTIQLLDWISATDKFLTTGSSIDLGKILQNIQNKFYNNNQTQSPDSPPRLLQKVGNYIEKISRSINLIRPEDLFKEVSRLEKIPFEQLELELGTFAKPFHTLLDKINEDYKQFYLQPNATEQDILAKQFLLIKWYTDKDLAAHAILLTREWIVSKLCVAQGLDHKNRDNRLVIEHQVNTLVKLKESQKKSVQQDAPTALTNCITKIDDLVIFWDRLTQYRNDIAHPQVSPHPISTTTLRDYVTKNLIDELTAIFGEYSS